MINHVNQTCPLCNSQSRLLFEAKDRNRRVSEKNFEYYRCSGCGLIHIGEIPRDLSSYYPKEYHSPPPQELLDDIACRQSFQIDMVRRFVKSGRLLEVGPSFSIFPYMAKRSGFDVDVIEMEDACCRYWQEMHGVNAVCSAKPEKAVKGMGPYDAVALWHVIEHLPEPWMFLDSAAERVRPGGIFLIAAPNPRAIQFRMLRSHWPHVDAPRHLYLIPHESLESEMNKLGFKLVMLTSKDPGCKGWNWFGWQHFFMNFTSNRLLRRPLKLVGDLASAAMVPLERSDLRGSAYTAIFRKETRA